MPRQTTTDQAWTADLRESQRVLLSCLVAREKLEIGDYEAGCAVLDRWWSVGEGPKQADLSSLAAGELLLVAGCLTEAVARTNRMKGGQRIAEALISGAVALFEQGSEPQRSLLARIELGCCYYHQGLFELAHSTLKLCISSVSDQDVELKAAALRFEEIGNLRYAAAVENNRGYLLLNLNRLEEAETHLQRARTLFSQLGDSVGCAQVHETLAQLHLISGKHAVPSDAIDLAVRALETSGEDALLAEALTTQGLIVCRLGRRQEAKPILEPARRVA